MDTAELKVRLISSITKISDTRLLEEVYRFLHLEVEEDEEVFMLSEEQKAAIMQAIKQIEQGKYSTNEEVEQYFEEWLKD